MPPILYRRPLRLVIPAFAARLTVEIMHYHPARCAVVMRSWVRFWHAAHFTPPASARNTHRSTTRSTPPPARRECPLRRRRTPWRRPIRRAGRRPAGGGGQRDAFTA